MRRIGILLAVLVVGLGVALTWRLVRQEAAQDAPSGGTGTVEGVEVDIVSRLSARIRAIHVEEGDAVKVGQVVVELDCSEPLAMRAEAAARVAVAEAGLRVAEAAARAARFSAAGARAAALAARHVATSARAGVFAAEATLRAAAAQTDALASERDVAAKMAKRATLLQRQEAGTEAELDTALGRARALDRQVASARASVAAARERRASAEGSAAASAAQADASGAQSRAARAQAAAAAVQIESARQTAEAARAALRRAEIAVAECKLAAPRAGVVLSRNFEPGEVVLPGARILTLADLATVRTTFFIPNAELAHAVPGRAVELSADAYPGEVFKGKILSVSSKAEFTPRNVQTREDRDRLVYAVKVEVPNPDGRLRPGMPVEVRIPGTRRAR
jgi:HlyD family secretion protein